MTVIQVQHETRDKEEEAKGAGDQDRKRARIEAQPEKIIIGGVIRDMVLEEEINWSRRREEILARLEAEELERERRIEKAQKMSRA